MDLNDLRILITAVSFLVFVGIVIWAYSGRQRARFEEAALLPFTEAELPDQSVTAVRKKHNGAGA